MQITTVTSKGQFTLPVSIRKKMNIKLGDKLISRIVGNEIRVKRIPDFFSFRGSIKSKRKFSQKLIKEWEEAAKNQAVKEYLQRVSRMGD